MRFAILLVAVFLAVPAVADGCGAEGCQVDLGSYRLALPDDGDRPVPAVLFLHGWGQSATGMLRNQAMVRTLGDRGYALIAPLGLPRREGGNTDWGVRDEGQHPRDDIAFLSQVLDDAATRGIDRDMVLLAGFSRGGSMVWDVACAAPDTARGYAAISGAFWHPMPESCAGPVDLAHVHGWGDQVVPLEGRSVANGRLTQGDVFAGLDIMRGANGCATSQPDEKTIEDDRWIRRWTTCENGSLALTLHPGGHGIPPGWLTRTLDWFESLDPAR